MEYIDSIRKNRYEIEHIWAARPEEHQDEFESAADFDNHRNLIGGLLLLPKLFNASYGDMNFEKKVEHYNGQNILARSLHIKAYDHNPGFKRFIQESGLGFKPYENFKKEHLLERQKLYEEIAEKIWDPERIDKEL